MLDRMHTLCMREQVERIYPWRPELFREIYDPAITWVIELDDRPVGMLRLSEEKGEMQLRTIILLPELRGRGIGRCLIEKILERGRQTGRPVVLQVLRLNPARRLYERLGFREIELTPTHHLMRWTP